jgi:hypothetical protein
LPDKSSNFGIDLWPAKAVWARSQAPEQAKAGAMPGDNGFRFDDNQYIPPSGPKTMEQNPKYPIPDSEPRARMFSLQYRQLLTEGKDLEAEIVTGTGKGAEAGEEANEKWNHGPGFIA